MSEWKEYRLEEVSKIVGGGTPKTSESSFWNGNIAWLSPRDLTGYNKVFISHGDRFITESGLKKSSAVLMPKGSVLLTSRAPIGYLAIAENEICTNQGFKSFIPNTKLVNNVFLYYWLRQNTNYLKQLGTGTTFAEISGTVVKSIKIKLPLLSEQKEIAEVLSSLDDKIDLLNRQNKTLEQMAETLFRQWFVEEAQDDWEEKPLSSIASFLNGLACQKFPPENDTNKLPVLKIKELRNGFQSDCDWCTSNVDSSYIIEDGDVIFSWSASLMVKLWDGGKCILNQHLFKVTSKEYPKWFYYFWNKHYLNQFIAISRAHATTMGHIKRGDLDKVMVLIPKKIELEKYSEIQTPLIDKIVANNKELKNLTHLRDTLLSKLMNGEIEVK